MALLWYNRRQKQLDYIFAINIDMCIANKNLSTIQYGPYSYYKYAIIIYILCYKLLLLLMP